MSPKPARADLQWDTVPGTAGAGNGAVDGGTGAWDTAAANWTADSGTTNQVFDTSQRAIFGTGTAGTATIGGTGITAAGLTFNAPTTGAGYTVAGQPLTLTANLIQAAGDNLISAPVNSSGFSHNITGGTLSLTNAAGGSGANGFVAGDTFTVSTGATLNASFGSTSTVNASAANSSNALGSAKVVLAGGTVNYNGNLVSGGLAAQVYAFSSHSTSLNAFATNANPDFNANPNVATDFGRISARLNTLTPSTLVAPNAGFTTGLGANRLTAGVTGYNAGTGAGNAYAGLDYGNVPAASPEVTGVGLTGTGPSSNTYQSIGYNNTGFGDLNNFVAQFTGKIAITAGGSYTFTTRSDDGSALLIDGAMVANNNAFQGMTNRSGTVTLTPGLHDIEVLHYEGSGGSGLVAAYTGPDTVNAGAASGTAVVIPASVLSAGQGRYTIGNSLSVTASTTVNVNNADQAVAGALDMNAGTTLTLGGSGALRVGATTLNGSAGANAYTFSSSVNDIILGNLIATSGTNTTIIKTGTGSLILDTSSTAASLGAGSTLKFDVQNGRLVAVSQSGQQNPLGAGSTVQLSNDGTSFQLDSRTGNVTFDNPVLVTSNATIEANSDNNSGLTTTLGSAANRLSIADGKTLTFDTYSNVNLLINPSATASTGAVVKTGPGALQIAQVVGYTGTTTVSQGTLQFNVANALPGSVAVSSGATVSFAASNSYTSPLSNFTFSSGSMVQLGATDALGGAAQQSLPLFAGAVTQITLSASGALANNVPLNVYTGSRAFISNSTAVNTSDTLNLYPGSVLDLNANITGAGTINRAPGLQVDIRGNGNLASQLPPANIGAFGTVRLRGDVADDLALNLSTLSTNSIIELFNGNRRLANANFTLGNNPVFLTNDNASRTVNDGGGTLSIGAGGLTIAATSNTTFQINENITTGNNTLTFGTPLVLNGNRKDFLGGSAGTPIIYLTHPTANNFAGGTVNVVAGTQLRGQANSAAGNFGAFGASSANLMNPVIYNGTLRVDSGSTTADSGLAVGQVTAAGSTTLSVGRAASGFNTSLVLNAALARSNRGTVNLFTSNNKLGSSAAGAELIVFTDPATQAPARVTTSATLNMVAPWLINTSGSSTSSFVDYDTGATTGFANVAYTTFAGGNLTGATDTTIADVTTAAATVGSDTTVAALRTNQNITGAGKLTVATGGVIMQGTTTRTISAPLNFGSAEGVLHSNGAINVISGAIDGSNGIIKTGASTLQLTGTNTFTGTVTIDQASLVISQDAALGDAANPVVLNGGNLRPAFTGSFPASRTLTLNAGYGDVNPDGAAITYTIDGQVTGAGALVKNSVNPSGTTPFANALVLTNTNNNYTGGTIVRQGSLQVSSDANLGAASGPLTIDNAQFAATASFATARSVFLTNANANIDVASGATLELSGAVIGTGSLIKTSSGTLILSSPSGNGYQGTTIVNAGTLLLNNGGLTGTGGGAVTVNNAAVLGGTGSIAGPVTLTGTSTLSPGASPGTLDIARDLTLGSTTTVSIELAGNTPGDTATSYDQVNVAGAAGLAGNLSVATLSGFTPSSSDVFYILSRDTGSGTFAGLSDGSTVTVPGVGSFTITYSADWTGTQSGSTLTGGNDVALYNFVAAPEPSAAALLTLAAAGLLSRRRRRR